jgi:hypothetical protein
MKQYKLHIVLSVLAAFLLGVTACEEVITLSLPISDPKVVVEGTIENGSPPLVFLSRSFPFFGDVDINEIEELLIRGAIVTVTTTTESVRLMEYDRQILEALSEEDFELIESILEQYLGFDISQDLVAFLPDISFYSVSPEDIDFEGETNRNYELSIQLINDPLFGSRSLKARTYIPDTINLDSLWVEPHPLEEIDTLFQLRTRLDDPDTSGNYYRYFNRAGSGPWLTPSNSAFDDAFLDGESVPFTVVRGQTEREKLEGGDFDVIGYWSPGDTAHVKLSMITKPHYDFWRTVENEKGNLGNPFGSFTVIASNIEGGVGIWGGYASTEISIIIPEEL